MSTLEIKDLYAHVETKDGIKPILKGVNLTVNSGETHAIMGPNGSGKSTLAYTLAGHPKYVVDSGQVLLDGEDILKMTPDEMNAQLRERSIPNLWIPRPQNYWRVDKLPILASGKLDLMHLSNFIAEVQRQREHAEG